MFFKQAITAWCFHNKPLVSVFIGCVLLCIALSRIAVGEDRTISPPELQLSLHDAIQAAIDNNVNVRLLRERTAAAQSAADTSLGVLLPNVSGYATVRNQTVNLAAFGVPQDRLNALGTPGGVTQPFDVYDARARDNIIEALFRINASPINLARANGEIEQLF